MDGTLTPSRREMTPDFEEFYSKWAKNHTFFLVSGSNLEKITLLEQTLVAQTIIQHFLQKQMRG